MAHTELTAPAPAPERMHALDAVRGFALMAGIVFHATMSFLPGPQIWITRDSHQSATLAVVLAGLKAFPELAGIKSVEGISPPSPSG